MLRSFAPAFRVVSSGNRSVPMHRMGGRIVGPETGLSLASKGVFVWRLFMLGIRRECVEERAAGACDRLFCTGRESVPGETHGILTRKGVARASDRSEERRHCVDMVARVVFAVWVVPSRLERKGFQPIPSVGCGGWGAVSVRWPGAGSTVGQRGARACMPAFSALAARH
jgi:hypothetical protein